MALLEGLRAAALEVLKEILGGIALILLVGSLLIVYGGYVW